MAVWTKNEAAQLVLNMAIQHRYFAKVGQTLGLDQQSINGLIEVAAKNEAEALRILGLPDDFEGVGALKPPIVHEEQLERLRKGDPQIIPEWPIYPEDL